MLHEDLTEKIIGAAIQVHRHLGPGLLESTYRATLAHEINLQGLPFQKEVELPVRYKDVILGDEKYRVDFIVNGKVIVEAKAVLKMHLIYKAQTLTYMKHAGIEVGLLTNFNVERLVDGVERLIRILECLRYIFDASTFSVRLRELRFSVWEMALTVHSNCFVGSGGYILRRMLTGWIRFQWQFAWPDMIRVSEFGRWDFSSQNVNLRKHHGK